MKVSAALVLIICSLGASNTRTLDNGTRDEGISHLKPTGYLQLISGLEDEIEKLRQELTVERLKRVAALTLPANYGEAEALYNQLNNISLVTPIVEELYGDPYHESLVGFMGQLHTLPERLLAYRKWVELLEDNNGLLSGGILVFRKLINDEISAPGGSPPQELVDLDVRLAVYEDTVLSIWIREIRGGNFDAIIDFGSPAGYHMIGPVFEQVLEKIVVGVLGGGETEYLLKALDFVTNLRWNKHVYVGLKAVYDKVDNDRRLVVALKIKETMEGCLEGPDPSDPVRSLFKALKDSMSPNVKSLLWHDRCNLKNVFYGEYLYGDPENFDTNNKRIFTSTALRNESPFLLVAKLNGDGDGVIFRIENKYWPDYKHLDGHTSGAGDGSIKKYVSLQRNVPQEYNWRVELSASVGEVMLFNDNLNGYLMADVVASGGRRNAVIWATNILDPTTHVWTLECVLI